MKIKIIKYTELYHMPEYKYTYDAGLDCYLNNDYIIKPHETVNISLGFGIEIPNGYCGILIVRSSYAKLGLNIALSPIDATYTGPIHAIATNMNDKTTLYLTGNERICQLLIIPCISVEFIESENIRKNKGLGSTNKEEI